MFSAVKVVLMNCRFVGFLWFCYRYVSIGMLILLYVCTLQASYLTSALIVVQRYSQMASIPAYTDNAAIENFREYLRIKTVQPKPAYGNIFRTFYLQLLLVTVHDIT